MYDKHIFYVLWKQWINNVMYILLYVNGFLISCNHSVDKFVWIEKLFQLLQYNVTYALAFGRIIKNE